MSKVTLPYLPIPPGVDKIQFGHKFFCLPYLPIQLVCTFWNKSLLLEKVSKTSKEWGVPRFQGVQNLFSIFRGVQTISSSFREGRDYFQNYQGGFCDSAQFYKYGHQYLAYLSQKILSKLFFLKCMAEKYPTYLWLRHMSNLLQYYFLEGFSKM